MRVAAFVTAVAIVFSFAVPASTDDRQNDPFGDHTIELNKEASLFGIWEETKCCSIEPTFALVSNQATPIVRR
jgi:hypothetical protein